MDHLVALEKSPHTLENYCRHLARFFVFLEREQVDWRSVRPDDLVHFIQWLRDRTRSRFKERIRALEEQVRLLQEENELLYGKLTKTKGV